MIQEDYGVVEFRELRPLKFGQAQSAIWFSQETVIYIIRVEVNSNHRPVRSNGPPGTEVPRNVELDHGAVSIAHKAVIHVCTVHIPPRRHSIRIDIPGESTLVEARTGVRSIENCNRALLIQQEAVIHNVRGHEGPHACT